jgi:hypothetical protein
MSIFKFANNVSTTLANTVGTSDTTITIASTANLPTLASGQVMPLTLNDASTGLLYEILYVTAISGTSLTVLRAQEGTSAQSWKVGDYAMCNPTAGAVGGITGNLQPTITGTLPLGNNVQVMPGTLTSGITMTLPSAPLVGSIYSIYGSASAFSVTVQTGVSSGAPALLNPNGSSIYSYVIPASSPGQLITCIWDGTNWRVNFINFLNPYQTTLLQAAAAGAWPINVVSANASVSAWNYYAVNVSVGAVTLTLPVSPNVGDQIAFSDALGYAAINNITISQNGQLIRGVNDDLVINLPNLSCLLVYTGATQGWIIF